MRSESYKECDTCGADCVYARVDGGPCWGEVSVVGEDSMGDDWYWIHACEGHSDYYDHGPYKSEVKNENK